MENSFSVILLVKGKIILYCKTCFLMLIAKKLSSLLSENSCIKSTKHWFVFLPLALPL